MKGLTSTDPRWKAIHEDSSDLPGDRHPAMVALKTGTEVRHVVAGIYNSREERHRWISVNAIPQLIFNEVMRCAGGKLSDDLALFTLSIKR
ncbi:MAG TPA: hypothetical protein VGK02_05970 [Candidatus Aquicultor sp.]|jgi:hypothetical protein